MRRRLDGIVASFQFLSRIPVPISISYTKEVFAESVRFYPLVGAVLGTLVVLFGYGSTLLLPPFIAAVLTLVWAVSLTGALHIDGLMDTADGILSHRPREQMLEIMKDSRVGAMGVIVCVLVMMLKGATLYTLLDHVWTWKLVLPFIWSRWFMTLAIVHWPYARKESGMGSYFQQAGAGHVVSAAIMAIILSVVAYVAGGMLLTGSAFAWHEVGNIVWVALASLCIGWVIAAYMSRKLGGLTGDTYGALNELLELLLLLLCVVLI